MSELRNNTVSTDKFDYANRVYSAEISDLGQSFRFTQIYTDAADRGFTLQSRTGKVANFFVAHRHEDGEGDTTHWTLLPTPEAIRQNPNLHDVHIVLFNHD
jgi:hypothetical protein